ncbi:MAG: glycoside hydrolase family 3 C-terminal domain-containing protein [Clostridia bacterium]|nr:glycoside hydrolase family 3 C-terminal domain-containing protein [Clostridia bacterium]
MSKFLAPTSPEITERETKNQARVRAIAGDCMVLLENDGTLPLKEKGNIALYGNGARATVKGGTGSGDVYVRETINIEEGLRREGFQVTTGPWLDRQELAAAAEKQAYEQAAIDAAIAAGQPPEAAHTMMMLNPLTPKALAEITEEDVQTSDTDTAVFVLARNSGEGKDRSAEPGDYELSDAEVAALRFLAEKYAQTIVLLNVGGVIDTKPLRHIPGINALVLIGQMGNTTGLAVADLLTGKAIPSGKLTDTWAENYGDYPSSAGFSHNDGDVSDEYYTEGVYVGYRYFDTFQVKPAYEFGFGRSYTDFEIQTQEISLEGSDILAKVLVRNVGKTYAGREVVQVYVSAPQKELPKPWQELRGFAKTRMLTPGEEELLKIRIRAASLASFSPAESAWVLESGDYLLRVGNSSRNTKVAAVIQLAQNVTVNQVRPLFQDHDTSLQEITPPQEGRILPGEAEQIANAVKLTLDPAAIACTVAEYAPLADALAKKPDRVIPFQEVAEGQASLDDFIAQLTEEELAYLMVGNSVDNVGFASVLGSAAKTLPGAAGETTGKLEDKYGLKQMELCDGPAGLRLTPEYIEQADGTAIGLGGMTFGGDEKAEGIRHYQYLTAIPIALNLASSWDLDLIAEMGDLVGSEMEEFGATLWLAPGMNIHRNPLCGRNFEYYSEDPLLAGKCAAADTEGVQRHPGYGTTIKHFLANNQEDNRMFTNSHISERAIREIYARNFQITVEEAQPMSLMTSYNLVNGVHSANNVDSVTHLLRDEWGFQGMVMTDWLTTSDLSKHLAATSEVKYDKSDAALCVKAQNDLVEPGEKADFDRILEGLAHGVITRAHLERNARNILTLMLRTHLYANQPYGAQVPGKCITFAQEK